MFHKYCRCIKPHHPLMHTEYLGVQKYLTKSGEEKPPANQFLPLLQSSQENLKLTHLKVCRGFDTISTLNLEVYIYQDL